MKILHISRRFSPFHGGTESYIYEITKRLNKRGFENRVLCMDRDIIRENPEILAGHEVMEGIEVFRIKTFRGFRKPIPLERPDLLIEHFRWADIVHIHDIRFLFETSLVLKYFLKFRLILSTHGLIFHTDYMKAFKYFLFSFYYRHVLRQCDAIICDSKHDFNLLKNFGLKKMLLIENGIDFEKYAGIVRTPVKGNLLYFGRIDTNKGIHLLLNVLALLRNGNWHLDIVGTGKNEIIDNLKRKAEELGLSQKITWHGFLEDEDLIKLLSEAHLCIFPSIYEGFGFTLLEAMAVGCPCIANDIPTYRDFLDDGQNGYLVDFSDTNSTSALIDELLSKNSEWFEDLAKRYKENAKRYDWNNKIEEIVKVYKGILG